MYEVEICNRINRALELNGCDKAPGSVSFYMWENRGPWNKIPFPDQC